jgi:hypothetical protein
MLHIIGGIPAIFKSFFDAATDYPNFIKYLKKWLNTQNLVSNLVAIENQDSFQCCSCSHESLIDGIRGCPQNLRNLLISSCQPCDRRLKLDNTFQGEKGNLRKVPFLKPLIEFTTEISTRRVPLSND